MKNLSILFILAMAILAGTQMQAQVAFSTVQSDVTGLYPGSTVHDGGYSPKNLVDKSVIPNQPYLVMFVRVTKPLTCEGQTFTWHRNVEARYDKKSSGHVFHSAPYFGTWLVGVPGSPNLKQASDLIESDLNKFFGSFTYNKLTRFDGVTEIITDRYEVEGCDNYYYTGDYCGLRVKFKVKVKYQMLNNTRLEEREDIYEITFIRESLNSPWSKLESLGKREAGSKLPLSSVDLTPEQVKDWECKTLGMLYMKEHATEEFEKLPAIEVPEFKSAEEMIWFTHRFFMTSSPDQIRKYLWANLSPNFFSKCGDFILSDKGEDMIESIIAFTQAERGSYSQTYCEYPKVKEQQGTNTDYTITYYTKLLDKFSRIHIGSYDGKLKIIDISLGKYREENEFAALEALPEDKCKEFAPATWSRYNNKTVDKASLLFPIEPVYDENTKSMTAKYKGAEYTMKAEILDKNLLSQIKQESQRPATAKIWAENFRKALGAQVKTEGSFKYGKTEGVEYIWKLYQNRQEYIIRYRSILYEDGYYQFWIYGASGSEEENQFFESLEINK
jgi:hypothetical protein